MKAAARRQRMIRTVVGLSSIIYSGLGISGQEVAAGTVVISGMLKRLLSTNSICLLLII
jgi:hypothetical protein